MPLKDAWDYRVRVFKGQRLLIETVHRGVASRDIELEVCRERMLHGEVSHVEVIEQVPPFRTYTIYE